MNFLVIILLWRGVSSLLQHACCEGFENRICLSCPQSMHLYRGNCIMNVQHCSEYVDGFTCKNCQENYTLTKEALCVVNSVNQNGEIYTDEELDLDGNSPIVLGFKIVDKILRAEERRLIDGKAISVWFRAHKNGNQKIIVEYATPLLHYFQVTLSVMEQNILKFESIANIPFLAHPTHNYEERILNLFSEKNKQILMKLDKEAKRQFSGIYSLMLVKQRVYESDFLQYRMLYNGIDKNYLLIIQGLSKNQYEVIRIVPEIKSDLDFSLLMDVSVGDLEKDEFYLIVKSFIDGQTTEYANRQPEKVSIKLKPTFRTYFLTFKRQDDSLWELEVTIDIINFILYFQNEQKSTGPTAPLTQETSFTPINLSEVFKDIYFLITRSQIASTYNSKYQSHILHEVQLHEEANTRKYRIYFQEEGSKTAQIVEASIDITSFAVSVEEKGSVDVESNMKLREYLGTLKEGFEYANSVEGYTEEWTQVGKIEQSHDQYLKAIIQEVQNQDPFLYENSPLLFVNRRDQYTTIQYQLYYIDNYSGWKVEAEAFYEGITKHSSPMHFSPL